MKPVSDSNPEDNIHVEEVINELINIRKAKELSQMDIAEIMYNKGRSFQGRVSDIENKLWDIRLSTLMKYTRAMGKRIRITIEDQS